MSRDADCICKIIDYLKNENPWVTVLFISIQYEIYLKFSILKEKKNPPCICT